MKVNVIIPTRGDRPQFVDQALKLIGRQTVEPDEVRIIESDAGITRNYREGYSMFKTGIVVAWEDDDFYPKDYIETMVKNWDDKYDLLGINKTIYYHLKVKRYRVIPHPAHSSMMSTVIKAGLKIDWPKDSEPFLDMILWAKMNGKLMHDVKALGIKHGMGLTVGAGHNTLFYRAEDPHDEDSEYLKAFTGSDPFYQQIQKQL